MKTIKKIIKKIGKFFAILIAIIGSIFTKPYYRKVRLKSKKRVVKNTFKIKIESSNEERDPHTFEFVKLSDEELKKIDLQLDELKNDIKVYYEEKKLDSDGEIKSEILFENSFLIKPISEEELLLNRIDNIKEEIKNNKDNLKKESVELIEKIIDEGFATKKPKEQVNLLAESVGVEEPEVVITDEEVKEEKKEKNKDNYCTITTNKLEQILDKLKDYREDYELDGKLDRYEYRIKDILKEITELHKEYKLPRIQELLEKLKLDSFTKRADKYDILFNDEIFKNITNECNKVLEIRENLRIEKEKAKKEKRETEEAKKKEMREKVQKEVNKKIDAVNDKNQRDNIRKRFEDLFLANKLLLEEIDSSKGNDIFEYLGKNYVAFIIGDSNHFNFDRNKSKYEVVRLYNNLLYTSFVLEGSPYYPLSHINVNYRELSLNTMELQAHVEKMITRRYGNVIPLTNSGMVLDKLYGCYEREIDREVSRGIVQPKVLKKDFQRKS